VSVGVVGLGPWGSRLARTFAESARAELRWVCDRQPLTVRRWRQETSFTPDVENLLCDETLDAVAFATPPPGRAALVARALAADKHVYVEGPIATRPEEASELIRLAEQRNRRLMVGHVLLFDPGVRKLKELIELGRLGELYYLDAAVRTTAPSAGDGSVLTGLAGGAVATMLYLVGDEPIEAHALTESYVEHGAEMASCYLRFATGIAASIQLSSLDAREQCRFEAVGSRRTGAFDGCDPLRRLTIFERSSSRGAEIVSPRIATDDPLRLQCETFLAGVRAPVDFASTRIQPAVVRSLERLARVHDLPTVPQPARPLRLATSAPEGETLGA
jgi:predicted dehydrogenase